MKMIDTTTSVKTKNIWYSISKALWDADLVESRLTLSLAEFIWSVILVLPGNTLAVGPEGYSHMLQYMPENVWALVFFISGCAQMSIVLWEQYNFVWTRFFAAFNALLWIFLVSSIIIDSYPPLAGIAGEFALMITAIWIWIRPYILAEGLYRAGIRKEQYF